jgi:Spy/CpxP family protein refolding chaperone
MKASLLVALFFAAIGLTQAPAQAQAPAAPAAPVDRPAVALTPEQIDMISKQLAELEGQIDKMRNDTLSSVLQKLRAAVNSDAAAMAFYIDCEKLVSVGRKELDRDEAKRLAERIERNNDRRNTDEKDDGDPALATRLQLQYLILSLEAHEAKDRATMIPKLQAYIQDVLTNAPKLKGRAFGQLAGDLVGDRNAVVSAFQIQRYLKVDQWTTRPADLAGMWTQTILPWYHKNKPEELPTLWDNRLSAQATLLKAIMPEAEYALWLQNEYPALRWERAEYLVQKGPSPINGLADMLKLIKESPGHADAPKWLKGMRAYIESAVDSPSGT